MNQLFSTFLKNIKMVFNLAARHCAAEMKTQQVQTEKNKIRILLCQKMQNSYSGVKTNSCPPIITDIVLSGLMVMVSSFPLTLSQVEPVYVSSIVLPSRL